MSRYRLATLIAPLYLVALVLPACDGQQYVSPDTVALIITNDATSMQRVNRCHFIPVLLGSQVQARYSVEDDLKVTITITRDDIDLSYQDPGRDHASSRTPAKTFEDGAGTVTLDNPPDGYTVVLSSPCTPDDD